MPLRPLFAFMLSLLIGAFSLSCDVAAEDTFNQDKAEGPKDYLRLPLAGAISTLDPGLTQFLEAIELSEQLFLGLTDLDPKSYRAVPELAERWEVDASGKHYTFYLRRDVRWTDGKPVTAHDVAWAIRRNLEPALNSPNASILFLIKHAEAFHNGQLTDAAQVGVQAVDAHTLTFELENPVSYFPILAGTPVYRPLPQAAIAHHGSVWTEAENIQTNGSYRIQSWNKGSSLILQKNPDYYAADKVAIPEVHYYIVPKSSLGLMMYEANELDVLGGEMYLRIPLNAMSQIRNTPALRRDLRDGLVFCTEVYGFNTQLAPTNNVWVRKAMNAAVNKQMLLDFVVKGFHEPASTLTHPPILGSIPAAEYAGIHFDPDQARAWLAQAGYPDGKNFPELVLVHNKSETHTAIAKGLQVMFKAYLNIDITVRSLEFNDYVDTLFNPSDAHMYRIGWCADYPDANNFILDGFHPSKSDNFVRWNNPRYAELSERAQHEQKVEKRRDLYWQAERILTEQEAVILPLYFARDTYLVKPWVKNWFSMAVGGQRIRDWELGQ
jgi:ABC-type oligopeptide transport system substrate-binding subunit